MSLHVKHNEPRFQGVKALTQQIVFIIFTLTLTFFFLSDLVLFIAVVAFAYYCFFVECVVYIAGYILFAECVAYRHYFVFCLFLFCSSYYFVRKMRYTHTV